MPGGMKMRVEVCLLEGLLAWLVALRVCVCVCVCCVFVRAASVCVCVLVYIYIYVYINIGMVCMLSTYTDTHVSSCF